MEIDIQYVRIHLPSGHKDYGQVRIMKSDAADLFIHWNVTENWVFAPVNFDLNRKLVTVQHMMREVKDSNHFIRVISL